MRLVLIFARAYPARSALMLACLVLAGLAEGIGVSSVLPLINQAAAASAGGPPGGPGAGLAQAITAARARRRGRADAGRPARACVAGGIVCKALLVLVATKQVGYTVAHVATDLRLELIRALLRSRWQYYVHQPIGVLAGAVASEARRAGGRLSARHLDRRHGASRRSPTSPSGC